MSSFNIPNKVTRRWTGNYAGNYLGTIWKSRNIDLDREEGMITLSERFEIDADTSDTNTDTLGTVVRFVRTDADCIDRYWSLTDAGTLHRIDSGATTFAINVTNPWGSDTLISSPTGSVDMAVFERDSRGDSVAREQLFVTTDTDISVLNDTGNNAWTANWWITGKAQAALRTGVPHPLAYFPFRGTLLIGDGNLVHVVSRTTRAATETVTNSRLIFPTQLVIRHIFTTANRAWFLCGEDVNTLSNTSNGKIIEWDGYSEKYNAIHDVYSGRPLSGVNFRETPIILNEDGMILEYDGKSFVPMIRNGQKIALSVFFDSRGSVRCASRGMVVGSDQLIYMALSEDLNNASARHTAGVWCLDPITGRLYNKISIGRWTANTFGQVRSNATGALYQTELRPNQQKLLMGGTVFSDASTSISGIWSTELLTSTTANRGYFVTQIIPAENVRDFWDTMWVRFKRFITATNRIIVKGRGVRLMVQADYTPINKLITWTAATTFTITMDAGDDALAVGDEVEVVYGTNEGLLAHITTISGAHAALQTITIDETASAASGTAFATVDRWQKLGVISSTTAYEEAVNIGINSSFVQFKIELRGPAYELEIQDLIINSESNVYNKR